MSKKIESRITFIDLFCGIGGFRRSAEKYNMECVFSSDNDKFAQETYEHWYGEKPHGDINKYTETTLGLNDIPNYDVLFAGFPCQPFSSAGCKKGLSDPTKGTLFFNIMKTVNHHKPKAIVLENVKGILSNDKGETIKLIRTSLIESGYSIIEGVLNSYRFGVPQYRERWFCVAIRNDVVRSNPDNLSLNQGDTSPSAKLADILDSDNHKTLSIAELDKIEFHFANKHKFSDFRVKHDTSKYGIDTRKRKYGLYSYQKSDGTLRFYVGDKSKSGVQEHYYVHSGTYAPTILANRFPKLWDLKRPLSVNECLKLQGFPGKLSFSVSEAQAYKQIGNSVCVNVVESVISDMLKFGDFS